MVFGGQVRINILWKQDYEIKSTIHNHVRGEWLCQIFDTAILCRILFNE
jgi:hypothetical protein